MTIVSCRAMMALMFVLLSAGATRAEASSSSEPPLRIPAPKTEVATYAERLRGCEVTLTAKKADAGETELCRIFNALTAEPSPGASPSVARQIEWLTAASLQASPVAVAADALIPAVGAWDERFVTALADFVVKRLQQEAALYFQERLRDRLCANERNVLPATCDLLDGLNEASWSITAMTGQLKAALRQDFRDFAESRTASLHRQLVEKAVENIGQIGGDKAGQASRAYAVLRIGVAIHRATREARSPLDVLRGVVELEGSWCPSVVQLPATLTISSNEYAQAKAIADKVSEGCTAVVGALHEVQDLVAVALAACQDDQSCRRPSIDEVDLAGVLIARWFKTSPRAEKYAELQNRYRQLLPHLRTLDRLRQRVRHLREIQVALIANRDALSAAVEVAARETLRQRERLLRRDALENLLAFLREAAAVQRLADAPTAETVRAIEAIETHWPLFEALVNQEPAEVIAATARSLLAVWREVAGSAGEGYAGMNKNSLPYVYALAELAQAESSEAMVVTIERIAAPVGSYREKSKRQLNSITALVGLGGGREWARGDSRAGHSYHGLFAPIGLQLTRPKESRNGAHGVLLSLIDIGPLLAARDTESGTEKDARIGLKQVLSPGLYYTYSWSRDSPIVGGVGIGYTPNLLRTVAGVEIPSTRALVFFAMDLTLLAW